MRDVFPEESPYIFAGNNPTVYIDVDGKYKYPADKVAQYTKDYPKLTAYLKSGGLERLFKNSDLREGLRVVGKFTDEDIDRIAEWGENSISEVRIGEICTADDCGFGEQNGRTDLVTNYPEMGVNSWVITIDDDLVKRLENATSEEDIEAALFAVVVTLVHESTHHGDNSRPTPKDNTEDGYVDGKWKRTFNNQYTIFNYDSNENGEFDIDDKYIGNDYETGQALERGVWQFQGEFKQGEKGLEGMKSVINRLKENGKSDLVPKIEDTRNE